MAKTSRRTAASRTTTYLKRTRYGRKTRRMMTSFHTNTTGPGFYLAVAGFVLLFSLYFAAI